MWRSLLTRLTDRSTITSIADLAGIAAVTAGVALIFVPAAFITAGVLVLAASYSAANHDGAVK